MTVTRGIRPWSSDYPYLDVGEFHSDKVSETKDDRRSRQVEALDRMALVVLGTDQCTWLSSTTVTSLVTPPTLAFWPLTVQLKTQWRGVPSQARSHSSPGTGEGVRGGVFILRKLDGVGPVDNRPSTD